MIIEAILHQLYSRHWILSRNKEFINHYLEVDYDLSDGNVVTTANTLNILPPLLDRMEVIRLPGYTEDEKVSIADKYL